MDYDQPTDDGDGCYGWSPAAKERKEGDVFGQVRPTEGKRLSVGGRHGSVWNQRRTVVVSLLPIHHSEECKFWNLK